MADHNHWREIKFINKIPDQLPNGIWGEQFIDWIRFSKPREIKRKDLETLFNQ
jgi:hypothetical protein